MNFRIIREQIASLTATGTIRQSRAFGLGTAICALLGSAGLAQTASDFIDPLSEERVRIERSNDTAKASATDDSEEQARDRASSFDREANSLLGRARDGATSGAAAAQDRATGVWAKMRAAASDVAASLGLPTAGLVGILGLILAGLAMLVGWTLFRGKRRPRRHRPGVGVYARSREAGQRRMPGDAMPYENTAETQEAEFTETMPENFDTIFEEERQPTPPKTMDTAKWRKPNLDKLKASIKSDWRSDKVRPSEENQTLAAVTPATLATREEAADRNLDDVSDGWEDWDDQVKPEDDPWGETLTKGDDATVREDAALSRIKALRESLRAS